MVNEFRDRMVQPIVGIGHSMGAAQLSGRQPSPQPYNSDFTRVHLSLLHPRLLYSLVLIEPVIQNVAPKGPNAALFASFRNDLWPSREAAEASLKKNPMFKKFDRVVLNNYIKYGLREIPTTLYPIPNQSRLTGVSLGSVPVTLTTTKHQEAWSYTRTNFAPLPVDFSDFRERLISPELDPSAEGSHIFVRPETMLTFLRLSELRPSVLWVYGSHSPINVSPLRSDKMKVTGTGPGGSGGASQGKVREVVLQETGHMIPFEKVKECADVISGWIEKELRLATAPIRSSTLDMLAGSRKRI
ncbi:hypothetical protein MMC31_006763 [Peltigera leucophlebia]|nr:hypothetical protein [Peltigera leucophlebia]